MPSGAAKVMGRHARRMRVGSERECHDFGMGLNGGFMFRAVNAKGFFYQPVTLGVASKGWALDNGATARNGRAKLARRLF
jgi:hypothetical protein